MYNKDEDTKLIKTSVAKRSVFLTLFGIPMILFTALGKDNFACVIISVVYIIMLFINGITGLPLLVKWIRKDSTSKK